MSRIHAVYFAADDTNLRADVLRAAGYEVDECCSLSELADCLRANQGADLVCIADTRDKPAEGALVLARGLSGAPIVLFASAGHHYSHRSWDLEIEPLTHPSDWLAEIAELLGGTRVGSRRPQTGANGWHREQVPRARSAAGSRGESGSA